MEGNPRISLHVSGRLSCSLQHAQQRILKNILAFSACTSPVYARKEIKANLFHVHFNWAKLSELAHVSSGITLRGADAARHDPDGTHQLLRISDVSDTGFLSIQEPNLLKLDSIMADRFALKFGDLLVAARGSRMTASVFDRSQPCVAGGQFLVVRIRDNQALPEFLHWFLNLPSTQETLRTEARGSYVRSLSATSLNELLVPLPPVAQQQSMAEIHKLRLHEQELMAHLASLRTQFIDQALLQTLKA